jgi:hypothetical protein
MLRNSRLGAVLAVIGLAGVGTAALPAPAEAWWRGGWCCGVGVGILVPPVVFAPPNLCATAGLLPAAGGLLPAAGGVLPAAARVDPAALAGGLLGSRPLGLTIYQRRTRVVRQLQFSDCPIAS